jgi:hypothetical protein
LGQWVVPVARAVLAVHDGGYKQLLILSQTDKNGSYSTQITAISEITLKHIITILYIWRTHPYLS